MTKYPVSLTIDYPGKSNRLTALFRIILAIPIFVIFALIMPPTTGTMDDDGFGSAKVLKNQTAVRKIEIDKNKIDIRIEKTETAAAGEPAEREKHPARTGFGLIGLAVLLMILFRKKYPRWWFDWLVGLQKFGMRIGAYVLLLTDEYPSTDQDQKIHLSYVYPNVQKDLSRWMPLVKWFLAIPHYVILAFLAAAVILCTVFTWLCVVFAAKYPKGLFNFVVGTLRWGARVGAYAFLLTTDKYPPFRLGE